MADAGHNSPPARDTPLWRNLSFTLMWTSTAASGYGDRMIMLGALALLGGPAKNAESSSIQASTQFWFFLPYLVFNLFGGWLADRLPRKWLLLGCDELRGLILLASFIALGMTTNGATLPADQHWHVWAVLAATGAFAAIFNPTRNAIIPQIVPARQLQSSNAVVLVISVIASMIGVLIGSQIIKPDSADSVRNGLLMGARFYLVSGTFFAFMKPQAHVSALQAENRSLSRAVSYAMDHRKVITLIGVNALVWAAAAAVATAVLGVIKIHHGLSGEEMLKQFGLLYPMIGVGMLAGAGVIILIQTRHESTIVLMLALVGAGFSALLLGAVPLWTVTYAACFGVGLFGNIAIISALTLLQSICPNYIRGRIMGLNSMVDTVFSVAVYYCIWKMPKADHMMVWSMFVIGPLLIGVGFFGLMRHLRSGPLPNPAANTCWRLSRLFSFAWHRMQIHGKHHIPAHGPVIIVSNHTTAMDPFLIQSSTNRLVRWLMLTSYRLPIAEYMWKATNPICLDHDPKTDSSEPGIKQVRQIVRELKKGDLVGIFPEGQLQYDNRVLKPFEDGAAATARLAKAALVPCWIDGTVLSKSMAAHLLKPTHSHITYGPPFTPDPKAKPEEITAEIRRRIIELGEKRSNESRVASNG